jgi:hypothetical protein
VSAGDGGGRRRRTQHQWVEPGIEEQGTGVTQQGTEAARQGIDLTAHSPRAVVGDGVISPGEPSAGDERQAEESGLVIDQLTHRLDALAVLRQRDDAQADALLEQIGARGKVETDMLREIGAWKPLFLPDRFEQAHRTAMRALEVFDRNGARAPSSLRNLGPLKPVASFVVQLFVRMIVRNHQRSVIDSIRHLYARREANSVPGSSEWHMLRVARIHAERLAPGFKKNSVGLPTFLFGGAVISTFSSALGGVVRTANENRVVLLIAGIVFALVAAAGFWCILQAAAIARRRCRIALDAPLKALWETIGEAGRPPRDQSRQFTLYALALLILSWIVVPVLLPLVFFR